MARWKVSLSHALINKLIADAAQVHVDQASDKLPLYPQFVFNLLKDGETSSEEFLHAAVGLAGESAGEVLEHAKKVFFYGKELPVEQLIEELGDMRFYYQAVLNLLGISDEQVVAQNMQKLRVRYASGKFSSEQALARADKQAPAERKFMHDSKEDKQS